MMTDTAGTWSSVVVAQLAVDALTPVAVVLLGLILQKFAQRIEQRKWISQQLLERRAKIFDEVAPLLNDLFCYGTYVGHWRDISPDDILELKRKLDKTVHMGMSLFSSDLRNRYQDFMTTVFKTGLGKEQEAKSRANVERHREAWGDRWRKEWDERFVASSDRSRRDDVQAKFEFLINGFAREIGLSEGVM